MSEPLLPGIHDPADLRRLSVEDPVGIFGFSMHPRVREQITQLVMTYA